MKKCILAISMGLILLTGCGDIKQKNNSANQSDVPTAIEAEIKLPERAEIGAEVPLAVTVTQGKDFVEDANEVKFEIWQEGLKNNSETVEAKYSEKGRYLINYKFLENGIYHVQSHVAARNMHTMPEVTIQIGNVEEQHEHAEGNTDHEHSHNHDSDVLIQLDTTEQINTKAQTSLIVHIQKEEQPLTKANVRLEIFQGDSNPAWVDMVEGENGEYQTKYQFLSSGKYTVRIHVQNDEGLHEHTEVEVNVN